MPHIAQFPHNSLSIPITYYTMDSGTSLSLFMQKHTLASSVSGTLNNLWCALSIRLNYIHISFRAI